MLPVYRYSRWDGSQQVFPLHPEDLMEQVSEHLLAHGDFPSALRSLLQRGIRGPGDTRLPGLQELLQRIRQRRQEVLDRYDLSSLLENLRRELEEVVRQEREGLERRLEDLRRALEERRAQGQDTHLEEDLLRRMEGRAQQARPFLDHLPPDPTGRLQALKNYEFLDPGARQRFQDLLHRLQQRLLERYLRDLAQKMGALGPQERGALKRLLQDLNRLLEERAQGQRPDYQAFRERWKDLLGPDAPSTLDALVEHLQRQRARMESLLESLTPEQKRELEALLRSALDDPDLQQELARLARLLEQVHPMGSLRRSYPFRGKEPLDLDIALEVIEGLQRLDEAERQIRRAQHTGNPEEVDPTLLADALGEESALQMEHLRQVTRVLEEAGYIRTVANRFELTPKGIRRIGQKALHEVFACIRKGPTGQHPVRERGAWGEREEQTHPYRFGDPFDLHLQRTLFNALCREGAGRPVRLRPEDFEVYDSQHLTQTATVLMLDLSLSMAMRGNFLAAKRVALALDNLIRTQFPRDILFIVGFSTYAREVPPEKLPYLTWDEFDPYTNIQHGLILAQRLLSRVRTGSKQIIMVSDGEPTAHIEGGQLFLQYPPSPRTIRETLREVRRCTAQGITINVFMLDRNSYLVEFVDQMTRINRGRVFYTSAERLGQYVLLDYTQNRRRARRLG